MFAYRNYVYGVTYFFCIFALEVKSNHSLK